MSLFDIVTGEMASTATYSSRRWVWVPESDTEHPQPDCLGKLTIVCEHARRNKIETDSYYVFLDGESREHRRYDLINTDGRQAEAYRVVVTLGEAHGATCNCKAAKCKLECKHTAAMLALHDRDAGVFTGTDPVPTVQAVSAGEDTPECFRGLVISGPSDRCPF